MTITSIPSSNLDFFPVVKARDTNGVGGRDCRNINIHREKKN